jgi:hypothetical protein
MTQSCFTHACVGSGHLTVDGHIAVGCGVGDIVATATHGAYVELQTQEVSELLVHGAEVSC